MRAPPLLAVLGAVLLGGLWFAGHDNLSIPLAFAAEEAVLAPKPQVDAPSQQKLENAVFAGGCFWGVEGVFSHVKGVRQAVSGYSGAPGRPGSYERVSPGRTGFAEAVDRKGVVEGKSVSVRVDLGGPRSIKQKKNED